MRALTLIAVTHRHTPFAVLERVTLDSDAAETVASDLLALPGVDEAVVLSTCNRTELYLAGAIESTEAALGVLASHTGLPVDDLAGGTMVLLGAAASLHLFRVTAGLESRVVGEGEILGQVRAAAARASRHGTSGPDLDNLFRWATASGRRARRDAGGSAGPSLARTALDAAAQPAGATLVVGAGAMAAAVTAELCARRVPYRVAARRIERAARLTRHPDAAADITALADEIAAVSLVVCTTGSRTPLIDRRMVADAIARRDGRPLTIVDLSMPRNVAADVAAVPGVELIHLQDLHGGHGDLQLRRANDAVDTEHDRYLTWLAGRAAGPVIAALRQRVTAICLAEAKRELGPEAAVLARRLAGRILHSPTIAIKDLSAQGQTDALDALAAALGVHLPEATTDSILRAS